MGVWELCSEQKVKSENIHINFFSFFSLINFMVPNLDAF